MLGLPSLVPATFPGVLTLMLVLLLFWIAVSFPVYVAGKLVIGTRGSYRQAMGATMGGGVGYFVILYGATFFLGAVLGSPAALLAFVLALAFWLAVYKASFGTGWVSATGIVVVAWVALLLLDIALTQAFGVPLPRFYPF